MAKQSGLGDRLFVGGVDLSGDTQAINTVSGGPAVIDVTAINQSAMDRIGGKRDGRLEATTFFNPATSRAHPTLKTLPTTDRVVSYLRGTTLGNPAASLTAKQINYDGTRGGDGEFTLEVACEANGFGLQWARQLTAGLHASMGAQSLTSLDLTTVSTAFGAQAFLHVTAFTGSSCTVAIHDSADNAAFALITGMTFTAAAGVTAQRRATTTTQTVRRYVRVVTTGTYSACSFVVTFARPQTATVF